MVVQIEIDRAKCNGCKKCIEACTFGVLEWFEDRPIVVNPSNCSACLECKLCCPADAINVKEK